MSTPGIVRKMDEIEKCQYSEKFFADENYTIDYLDTMLSYNVPGTDTDFLEQRGRTCKS